MPTEYRRSRIVKRRAERDTRCAEVPYPPKVPFGLVPTVDGACHTSCHAGCSAVDREVAAQARRSVQMVASPVRGPIAGPTVTTADATFPSDLEHGGPP